MAVRLAARVIVDALLGAIGGDLGVGLRVGRGEALADWDHRRAGLVPGGGERIGEPFEVIEMRQRVPRVKHAVEARAPRRGERLLQRRREMRRERVAVDQVRHAPPPPQEWMMREARRKRGGSQSG